MKIGVPKEIKTKEFRVSMIPEFVEKLVSQGHEVFVETKAGDAIGFPDVDYEKAGAKVLKTAADVFAKADLIVKVKEPQAAERKMLKPHQTIFTYLHLAADKPQAEELMKSGCTAIAYETVTDEKGRTPLLAPMSRVAGRLSVLIAAYHLQSHLGGLGVLISGVQEAEPANVLILGGGQAGTSALKSAVGLGSRVTILDISEARLAELKKEYGDKIETAFSKPDVIKEKIKTADIVVGATYIPGAAADKLITKAMLKTMRQGSVLVDISIDQGGCFETSKPTTHDNPTFVVDGIIHYCVANMPGAVARTSAIALGKNTLPYIEALANKGIANALDANPALKRGLNICAGKVTNQAVAEELDLPYTPIDQALKAVA